ncbi:unnamed protein product [Anisakis simplex]|uniref:WASH-7_N domain-containing protein n=1 Tax=Anisakis simplex TaxID=6269 RepID=A0A0M3JPB3_ANISI|nr:unnamed protein product [Anisakis simplex]
MRNKKVASALSIPTDSEANNLSVLDGTVSSVPTYTDFLKAQLQKSFKHVLEVENALVDLVHAVELVSVGSNLVHLIGFLKTHYCDIFISMKP